MAQPYNYEEPERCYLCKGPYAEREGLCRDCFVILNMMEDLITTYLRGDIDPRAKNFLPEIDFLFMRNTRVMAYFNIAWEICLEFLLNRGKKIKKDELKELGSTIVDTPQIVKVIKKARIIDLDSDDPDYFLIGGLAEKLIDTKWKYGRAIGSEEFYNISREIRAIICLATTFHLVNSKIFTPREIISIFDILCQHIRMHKPDEKIVATIPKDRIDRVWNGWGIPSRQRRKLIRDLFGLHPGGPRLIRYDKDNGLVLKREVVIYLEYVRQRIRERAERERGQNGKM